MRINLLLLSLSLCVQTEGQAAVKEFGELGFAAAKRVVYRMNKPTSTLSSFQHHPMQQFTDSHRILKRTFSTTINVAISKDYDDFLSRLNAHLDKLTPEISQNEAIRKVYDFIKDAGISIEDFQKKVAENCANDLIGSKDRVLVYCGKLYQKGENIDISQGIPERVREDIGREIRTILDHYNGNSLSRDLKNSIRNVNAATARW